MADSGIQLVALLFGLMAVSGLLSGESLVILLISGYAISKSSEFIGL